MNTLSNFLIGINLDYDNKGAKQTVSSLDSIKRTALQTGAAVAGAFGARAITAGVADGELICIGSRRKLSEPQFRV